VLTIARGENGAVLTMRNRRRSATLSCISQPEDAVTLLFAALVGFTGAGSLVWWTCRKQGLRENGYVRKAILEITGGMVLGSLASLIPNVVVAISTALLVGAAWVWCVQRVRLALTSRIRRRSNFFLDWLNPHSAHKTSVIDLNLVFGCPGSCWLWPLHWLGFTDLTDQQLWAYDTYRSEVAWKTHPRAWEFFGRWLRLRWQPLANAAILTLLYGCLVFCYFFAHWFPEALLHLSQGLFILYLSLWIPAPTISDRNPEDADAVRTWSFLWLAFWGSWVLLYLGFFIQDFFPYRLAPSSAVAVSGDSNNIWIIAVHFFNNLNTCLLILCFYLLYDPPDPSSEARMDPPKRLVLAGALGAGAIVLFTLLDIWFWLLGWKSAAEGADWVSGFAGGIGFAMLVGRLESKYINAPILLIVLLYIYAVIQGGMGGFGTRPVLKVALLAFAFFLKCLLFLLIAWILESGLLLSYMREVRERNRLR
jgi:hypothetical protein